MPALTAHQAAVPEALRAQGHRMIAEELEPVEGAGASVTVS